MLDDRVQLDNGIFVPSARHHFLSMSFHVVFHKGTASGLPYTIDQKVKKHARRDDHDYASVLSHLANEANIDFPAPQNVTLDALLGILDEKEWAAPVDCEFGASPFCEN